MNPFEIVFPKSSKFGRVLPKKKIYEFTKPSTKVKQLFVNQVERITWAHKLSVQTTNINADKFIKEIQLFEIDQKVPELDSQILQLVNKAIQSPILFKLKYDGKFKYAAAQNRYSESGKRGFSQLFETKWFSENSEIAKHHLPQVLDLKQLYDELLKLILPTSINSTESLSELIDRVEKKTQLEKEINKLKKKLDAEKQFNRQVEINKQLKSCLVELKNLGQ